MLRADPFKDTTLIHTHMTDEEFNPILQEINRKNPGLHMINLMGSDPESHEGFKAKLKELGKKTCDETITLIFGETSPEENELIQAGIKLAYIDKTFERMGIPTQELRGSLTGAIIHQTRGSLETPRQLRRLSAVVTAAEDSLPKFPL